MPAAIPYVVEIVGEAFGMSAIGQLLVAAALTLLAKALIKEPGRGSFPINTTVRSTVPDVKIILGTVRASGSILFCDLSGTNNEYLWYVVAWAGHDCREIKHAWRPS